MPSDASLPKLQKATAEELSVEIVRKLAFSVGKDPVAARGHDWLKAAILVVRDRVIEQWMASIRETNQSQGKRVYYLSMEFLIGRLLRDAASNLGLFDTLQAALEHLGVEADLVEALEPDAALGNGGLQPVMAPCRHRVFANGKRQLPDNFNTQLFRRGLLQLWQGHVRWHGYFLF